MEGQSEKHLLCEELTLIEVFAIASGAMISSGLFVLPGIAYAKTGSSVIFSYLIASLLIIPAMLSKTELATAMPKAGGDYFFIDRSMGPAVGTIGGLTSWFALTAKTAFALIGIGAFVQLFLPEVNEFHIKVIAIVFCLIFTGINLRGVKHAGRTQVYLVFGLIGILLCYVIIGLFFIQPSRFEPVFTHGTASVFATAGFIFVSFMGLTKVCSVAEEIRKPKRTIPRGMFLSWGVISLIYLLVITVTIGVLDHSTLVGSLMPISLGAQVFLGDIGLAALGVAAVLAFVTTANAGLLSSSRYPLAMAKDHLFPAKFTKISRNGSPVVSLLFTAGFMITIILFLDLEGLVKTASSMVLLLFILVNLSLIMMRESKIRHYRPSFRSPGYPFVQIIGIIGYGVLLVGMGIYPLLLVGCFTGFSLLWYWLFARDKIWREYSLLHVVERLTGIKKTGYLIDEELREILIKRDNLEEKRFEQIIKNCEIVDMYKFVTPDKFAQLIAHKLADRLDTDSEELYKMLQQKEHDSNVVIHPGIAVFSHMIKGCDKFDMLLVRSKKGMIINKDIDPIHAFICLVASPDQQNFYLHSLMWMVQIAEETDFEQDWVKARDTEELRDIMLSSWKKRKQY